MLSEPTSLLLVLGSGSDARKLSGQLHSAIDRTIACLPEPSSVPRLAPTLLRTLGELWCEGIAVDWHAFQRDRSAARVALPTYPFERKRYWVDDKKKPSPNTGQAATDEPIEIVEKITSAELVRQPADCWLYVPTWLPAPPLTAPLSWRNDRSWLLFEDDAGLAKSLVDRLSERFPSHRFLRVQAAQSFTRLSDTSYKIDPDSPEDYSRLLGDVRKSLGRMPDVVLHLVSLDDQHEKLAPELKEQQAFKLGFFSILWLVQAWEREHAGPLELRVITKQLHDSIGGKSSCPAFSALLGPCQVLSQELPGSSCQVIELSPPADDSRLEEFAEQIESELMAGQAPPRVVLRGSQRWSVGYQYRQQRDAKTSSIRQQGVYLITGGLGNVGMTLAVHLAEAYDARLVLVTQSTFPPRDAWKSWLETHDANNATSHKIRRLEKLHAGKLLIQSADVCDPTQLDRVVRAAHQHFGVIHGVVHAAGIMDDRTFRRLSELDRENCQRQLRGKGNAVAALEESLDSVPLDFCLIVSSLSTVVGGFGYAAYAAAHHFLDALVDRHNRTESPCPWVCVNWDAWKSPNDDPHVELSAPPSGSIRALAQLALNPTENVNVFERLLRPPLDSRVIVSAADLAFRVATTQKSCPAISVPAPVERRPEDHERSDWATPLQGVAAGIWQDVLGTRPSDGKVDFFELGGDSLAAMQVISRVQDIFSLRMTAQDLFTHRTIASFADRIRALQQNHASSPTLSIPRLLREQSRTTFPLSFAQQRVWFLSQLEPESTAYHLPLAMEVEGKLDLDAIGESLRRIIRRHEVLRSRIEINSGELFQVVEDDIKLPLTVEHFECAERGDAEKLVRQRFARS